MPYTINHTRELSAGSTADSLSIDFTEWLDAGETVASVTITEIDTSALSLSNKIPNAAAIEVNRETVAIGKGVQCTINAANAVAGERYGLLVTPTTTPNARVVKFHVWLEAV